MGRQARVGLGQVADPSYSATRRCRIDLDGAYLHANPVSLRVPYRQLERGQRRLPAGGDRHRRALPAKRRTGLILALQNVETALTEDGTRLMAKQPFGGIVPIDNPLSAVHTPGRVGCLERGQPHVKMVRLFVWSRHSAANRR